jgi:hypothetical protein
MSYGFSKSVNGSTGVTRNVTYVIVRKVRYTAGRYTCASVVKLQRKGVENSSSLFSSAAHRLVI